MDQEPQLKLTVNNQEFIANPENTFLYTFLGRTAINGAFLENSALNHTYMHLSEESSTPTLGLYLFEQFQKEAYDQVSEFIKEHNYQQFLNVRAVSMDDVKNYLKAQDSAAKAFIESVPDFLPEDFK